MMVNDNTTFSIQETLKKVNQMYADGWCEGCSENPDDCIRRQQPKCLLVEKMEEEKNG